MEKKIKIDQMSKDVGEKKKNFMWLKKGQNGAGWELPAQLFFFFLIASQPLVDGPSPHSALQRRRCQGPNKTRRLISSEANQQLNSKGQVMVKNPIDPPNHDHDEILGIVR